MGSAITAVACIGAPPSSLALPLRRLIWFVVHGERGVALSLRLAGLYIRGRGGEGSPSPWAQLPRPLLVSKHRHLPSPFLFVDLSGLWFTENVGQRCHRDWLVYTYEAEGLRVVFVYDGSP
ncbi:uncharacterized protein A4U43_C05F33480 [Asparagus officinalis]|uniref:Uncharacterized protein n=1 Tax=Asparagus officinalis TaxID=4686 RepID=A0A5P1EWJ3_ASPOF|nr:uncharacterized protein A4U43_C05F33480 [Asparagus officinalis]